MAGRPKKDFWTLGARGWISGTVSRAAEGRRSVHVSRSGRDLDFPTRVPYEINGRVSEGIFQDFKCPRVDFWTQATFWTTSRGLPKAAEAFM